MVRVSNGFGRFAVIDILLSSHMVSIVELRLRARSVELHFLIHVLAAFLSSARTRQLDIFDGKLVVISKFFSRENLSQSEDDDMFLPKDIHNFGETIGLKKGHHELFYLDGEQSIDSILTYITRVVDESGCIATHGGIHYGIIVNLEHVATDSARFIVLFPLVR